MGNEQSAPELFKVKRLAAAYRSATNPVRNTAKLLAAAYKCISATIPELEFNVQQGFTFHDCYKSIDLYANDKTAICNDSVNDTVYSKQVVPGSRDYSCQFTVINNGSGPMAFGILGHQKISECRSCVLREKEIRDSVGLIDLLDKGIVVLYEDIAIKGPWPHLSLSDGTAVTVRITNGTLLFLINGSPIPSNSSLSKLGLTEGWFHMGMSLTKEGQLVTVVSILELLTGNKQSAEQAAKLLSAAYISATAPELEFNVQQGFMFHDCYKSINMDTKDKTTICKDSVNATVYSKQVVPGSRDNSCQFTVICCGSGPMAFGILGHQKISECGSHVLREKEIRDSVGLINLPDKGVVVLYKDVAIKGPWPHLSLSDGTMVTVMITNRTLLFVIDGLPIPSNSSLSKLGLAEGQFHMGMSLMKEGQLMMMDAKLLTGMLGMGSSGPQALWVFHDNMNSVDCDSTNRVAACIKKYIVTSTVHPVFDALGDSSCTFTIMVM